MLPHNMHGLQQAKCAFKHAQNMWIHIILHMCKVSSGHFHRKAVLMSTHNLCFEQKYEKYLSFLSENFYFIGGKMFSIFE